MKTVQRDDESLRELKETEARLKELSVASRRVGWTWPAIGAVCGLVGGVAAAILGTLLSAGGWALGDESRSLSLHGMGSFLLLSTIPLLLVGGYCLDLLDKRMTKNRQISSDDVEKAAKSNKHTRSHIAARAVILMLICVAHSQTQAQQTVFNVPTTDVLDPGKVYFELDISAKPNDPKFSSFVPRVVVGAGGRVEIGLNLLGNVQPGADATTLVPNIKWKFYDGKDNGWALAVGAHLHVPVRNKAYDVGNYSYVMASKTLKPGSRVGFGGYFFSKDVVAPGANRAGGQFTFEQAVTKKLNINADWFTGQHSSGYFTPGATYKLTNKLTGVSAYSIGNAHASSGNHFFYFELGYNFN